MIKVFLAGSEETIRENIRSCIGREDHNLCLVGEARDRELAYSMIRETEPDILITDIGTPFVDGFKLEEQVKENLSHIKIIILSDFYQFDFLNRILKIGIVDYLLKPLDDEKLLNAIHEAKEQVEKTR